MMPVERASLEPGQRVRHPDRPDWGIGQVQSAVGSRVTVNFEHAGKVLVELRQVALDLVDDDARDPLMNR